MDKDIDVLNALIEHLISHGYPKNAFSLEWPIGRYRVDLAIVDPDLNKPIALFEIKRKRTSETEKMGLIQYNNISNAMGEDFIPFYLVFGKDGGHPPFEMLRFEKEASGIQDVKFLNIDEIPPTSIEIPEFNLLRASEFRKSIHKTGEEKRETVNTFKLISVCLAAGVSVLLIFDILEFIQITTERLALIGIIAGLIIVPYASKLKILGFEYETIKKKE